MQLQDIIFAAIIATILTWVISSIKVVKMVVTRSTELGYKPGEMEKVMQRCYNLFPIASIRFKGTTFQRGMQVRVVTNRKKTIEGEFVGSNEDNMLCFLTNRSVVAHGLDSIEDMQAL